MSDRDEQLSRFKQMLMTENGQAFVEELAFAWDTHSLLGTDAEETAYKVGLRDAYRFVRDIQRGDFINDD
jgi:hypothetical protein